MPLDSLLISQDVDLVRILRPTLEKLSIQVEICQEATKANEILITEKFDAVIVDCDDVLGGLKVLRGLRDSPSNKNSVTFAVLNGRQTTTQEVFGMGVNFVLQKPISTLNATRCFNAALSFMVRERRRYFRALGGNADPHDSRRKRIQGREREYQRRGYLDYPAAANLENCEAAPYVHPAGNLRCAFSTSKPKLLGWMEKAMPACIFKMFLLSAKRSSING